MTVLPEWILVAKQRVEKRAKELPIPGLGDGNELIRSDVPRLVELVGEMAWNLRNVTDQVQDACRSRMTPLSQCPEPSDDYCPTCPTGLRGECGAPRSLEALRKFRGEVSSND